MTTQVVELTKFDFRLANKLDTDLQKLRCRVNYHALRFTKPILKMGETLVRRMKEKGKHFIALHLRWSFNYCIHLVYGDMQICAILQYVFLFRILKYEFCLSWFSSQLFCELANPEGSRESIPNYVLSWGSMETIWILSPYFRSCCLCLNLCCYIVCNTNFKSFHTWWV